MAPLLRKAVEVICRLLDKVAHWMEGFLVGGGAEIPLWGQIWEGGQLGDRARLACSDSL